MYLNYVIIIFYISLIIFVFQKRSDHNKFHLDYFLAHVCFLFLLPLLYTLIQGFNFDFNETQYMIGGVLHTASLISIMYHVKSTLKGYKVKIRKYHIFLIATLILLNILGYNGIYLIEYETSQDMWYDFVLIDKFSFTNLLVCKLIITLPIVVEFIYIYTKNIKSSLRIKNKKIYNLWIYVYFIIFFISKINTFLLFFDIINIKYVPFSQDLNSVLAITNTFYFIALPSVIYYLPKIKRETIYFLDDNILHGRKINLLFKEEKIFLNPDLNLRKVSLLTGLSENIIRASIKNNFNLNFNDFVNKYRVDYSIELMSSNYLQTHLISSLGEKSGFKSNQTFYRSFKKLKSITPAIYYKTIVNSSFK